MKEALRNLIDLQEIDLKLQALEELKGDLPQQVKLMKQELQEKRFQLDSLGNELSELKKTKLHWEGEIESYQAKLKKYQDQLYAVTSNKEYDAITLEIDATKEKIDEWETVVIESFETEESLTGQMSELQSEIDELKERLDVKEQELLEKIRETESDTAALMKRRKELVAHINKPIFYQYERIRKGKHGLAVVGLKKNACGGCYTTIPPQRVMEVRAMNQFLLCENCGRILVYRTHAESVVA